jgi:hypothetical protein
VLVALFPDDVLKNLLRDSAEGGESPFHTVTLLLDITMLVCGFVTVYA